MQSSRFLLTVLFSLLTIQQSVCQGWTWMGGDTTPDSLASGDYPGGRSGSSVWSFGGTVWLFGGIGFSDIGTGKSHLLNDVWSFDTHTEKFRLRSHGTWNSRPDPSTNVTDFPPGRQHAAMCGSLDRIFVFGGLGEGGKALGDLWAYNTSGSKWQKLNLAEASSAEQQEESQPPARGHPSVWCQESALYLFGGINDNETVFSDMWKLDLWSLTWTKLHEELNDMNSMSYPRGRNGAASWGSNDTLYMFGGNTDVSFSHNLQLPMGFTSDLWKYHTENNSWQFVADVGHPNQHSHSSGQLSLTSNQHSHSSEQHSHSIEQHSHSSDQHSHSDADSGTDAHSAPGSRVSCATWTDSEGNLWLFGGAGIDDGQNVSNYSSRLLSDVWMFDVDDQRWVFVCGSRSGETSGRYSELGKMTETNLPGARTEMMVWKGGRNLVYIFGGRGYGQMHFSGHLNDLWKFNSSVVFSREYLITPQIFLSFFGVTTLLLVILLMFAMCTRQIASRHGAHFRHGHEYSRLTNDISL